jgi:phospholipase/carboxylesterase
MTVALDGPRFGPKAGGAPRQLVMLLHGVGADGSDQIGLAPAWSEALPHAAFVAPDAPFPCDMAPYGLQWFGVEDRDPQRLAAGVRAVAPSVEAFLRSELDRLGLPPSALALMGFSQGAMTALFTGLRGAVTPATILAYSGALLAPESLALEIRARPPVLIVHGEADEVVPVWASRMSEAALRALGVPVESLYAPALGHGIDGAGIAAGAEALRRAFASTA